MQSTKRIPLLLNGSGHWAWKVQLLAYLQSKGLGAIALGTAEWLTVKYHQSKPNYQLESCKQEFDTRAEQVLGIIKLLVHLLLLPHLENVVDPAEVLCKLEAQLRTNSTGHFLTTMSKLFTLRKHQDQTIAVYLAEIDDLVAKAFPDLGADLPDPDTGGILPGETAAVCKRHVSLHMVGHVLSKWALSITLAGLPAEYDTARAIIQDWTALDTEWACAKIRE